MRPRPSVNNEPCLPTHELCKYLGFSISSERVENLGIEPAIKTSTGVYWLDTDFPKIARALAVDLLRLSYEI